jgi:hypothetical protein
VFIIAVFCVFVKNMMKEICFDFSERLEEPDFFGGGGALDRL